MKGAFITGSHAYGEPKETSDVDLVIPIDEVTGQALAELFPDDIGYGCSRLVVEVDGRKLDLLLMSDEAEYDAWRYETNALRAMRTTSGPVSRGQAIVNIKRAVRAAKESK